MFFVINSRNNDRQEVKKWTGLEDHAIEQTMHYPLCPGV